MSWQEPGVLTEAGAPLTWRQSWVSEHWLSDVQHVGGVHCGVDFGGEAQVWFWHVWPAGHCESVQQAYAWQAWLVTTPHEHSTATHFWPVQTWLSGQSLSEVHCGVTHCAQSTSVSVTEAEA